MTTQKDVKADHGCQGGHDPVLDLVPQLNLLLLGQGGGRGGAFEAVDSGPEIHVMPSVEVAVPQGAPATGPRQSPQWRSSTDPPGSRGCWQSWRRGSPCGPR